MLFLIVLCSIAATFVSGQDCYERGKETKYQGHTSVTESGKPCQYWSDQHRKYGNEADEFSDGIVGYHSNFCRETIHLKDTTDYAPPWCYYGDDWTEWEFCGIPVCPMPPVPDNPFNSGACNGGFQEFGGACYAYIDLKETWPDAQAVCIALGGYLAEVVSDKENQYINDLVLNATGDHHTTIWLGADDLVMHGTFYWAHSGAELTGYTDWASGEPGSTATHTNGEHCVEMNMGGNLNGWNDDQCEHDQQFVCQKPATSSEPTDNYVTGTASSIVG